MPDDMTGLPEAWDMIHRMNRTITALANRVNQQEVRAQEHSEALTLLDTIPDPGLMEGLVADVATLKGRIDGLQNVIMQLQQRVRDGSLRLDKLEGRHLPAPEAEPSLSYPVAAGGVHALLASAREEERKHWQAQFARQARAFEAELQALREERDSLLAQVQGRQI